MESYGPDGRYTKGMGMQEKYNSWAATQYREKVARLLQSLIDFLADGLQLAAACADPPQPWSPSAPPPEVPRPASAQATRKSRAGGGISSSSLNPSRTGSPSPYSDAPPRPSSATGGSGNEAFFERMSNNNALRPDDLPPSQGGRYAGFDSTPEPSYGSSSSSHPSHAMSSHSAPTLQELQNNPLGALSKGWGLFSSAVTTASREIQESVVKPGMSRAQELAQGQGGNEEWRKYLAGLGMNAKEASNWLSQRGGEGLEQLNKVAKSRGVDLDEQLAKLGISNQGGRTGYGQVGSQLDRAEGGDLTPHGGGAGGRDDDFFDSWDDQAATKPAATSAKPAPGKKKDDWNDDEWKDFWQVIFVGDPELSADQQMTDSVPIAPTCHEVPPEHADRWP